MAVISKQLFYQKINDKVSCNAIHYFEPDCKKIFTKPYLFANLAFGSAKFFLPIYLVKLIINYKKIKDKKFLKSLALAEIRSITYGMVLGSLLLGSICSLRLLFGRMLYYNTILVPGFVSGLSLLVESEENQTLDRLIFFNSLVESALINLDHSDILKLSKTRQTFLFMLVSSCLMYLLKNRKNNLDFIYFWFYTPKLHYKKENEITRDENDDSLKYLSYFKGFTKYFILGYTVNIIKKLLPKMSLLLYKPLLIYKLLINKSNVKFGFFIGSYVGVYRIVDDLVKKYYKAKGKMSDLIAGLLAGTTFIISPNFQVLVIGITTILQLFYQNIKIHFKISKDFWLKQLLFMCCHGILLHLKFFKSDVCSSYYSNMIDACSNQMTANIYKNLLENYIFIS